MHVETLTLHNGLLAHLQNSYLPTDIAKMADNLLIAIDEAVECIRDTNLTAEFHNQLLRTTKIVPRDARVQVMDSLELQATVDKIKPLRAVDVHCCP